MFSFINTTMGNILFRHVLGFDEVAPAAPAAPASSTEGTPATSDEPVARTFLYRQIRPEPLRRPFPETLQLIQHQDVVNHLRQLNRQMLQLVEHHAEQQVQQVLLVGLLQRQQRQMEQLLRYQEQQQIRQIVLRHPPANTDPPPAYSP